MSSLALENKINDLRTDIAALTDEMQNHQVFSKINHIEHLRKFMQWHVFAVWDFMTLLKRLQRELTCVSLPWVPSKTPVAAHLINEIVLGEESDCTPMGDRLSHFDMYCLAMEEVGADTQQIIRFIELIRQNNNVVESLKVVEASEPIINFVVGTIDTALNKNLYEVLGSFFYGREDMIPKMFERLLSSWKIDATVAPMFVFYLKRHIELDGDMHGPIIDNLIKDLTYKDMNKTIYVLEEAKKSIKLRIDLWNCLNKELENS